MNPAVFVYARMDSQRFPGKALSMLSGTEILRLVLQRASRVCGTTTYLLTTQRPIDEPLELLAQEMSIRVVRGATKDLVARTCEGLDQCQAPVFARVNGDSPFLDYRLISQGLDLISSSEDLDFVSNLRPRRYPYGIAVEWIRASTFRELSHTAAEFEKEHVTAHLYRQWDDLRTATLLPPAADLSWLSLVIDTPQDLDRLEQLVLASGKRPLTMDYLDFISANLLEG